MLKIEKVEYEDWVLEDAKENGFPYDRNHYYNVYTEDGVYVCDFDYTEGVGWVVFDLTDIGVSLEVLMAVTEALQKVISEDALEEMVATNQALGLYDSV